MITTVEQDELKLLDSKTLDQCAVPIENYMFYDASEIEKMGKKVHVGIFHLDGLLFKIIDHKILNAYFPIKYLMKYPNLL